MGFDVNYVVIYNILVRMGLPDVMGIPVSLALPVFGYISPIQSLGLSL